MSALPLDAGVAALSVVIVDDHEMLGQTLAFALGREGVRATTVPVTNERDLLAAVERLGPTAVLLDLNLGDFGSALVLVEPLLALGTRVIVMTGETDRAAWGECVESGAAGVVAKSLPFEEILEAITRAAAGEDIHDVATRAALLEEMRRRRAETLARLEPFQRLSVRECEVLHELTEGLSAEAIAARGFVSVTTVRSHIRAILQKLGVNSQLAAVALATRSGWISPHRRSL